GMGEHAVDQIAAADVDRQEHAGISAAGTDGVDNLTRVKYHAFTRVVVGGGDAQGNAQFFEGLHLQGAAEERSHAVAGGETVAGKGPAGKGSEARIVGDLLHLGDRQTAAIRSADQRAHAGAGND